MYDVMIFCCRRKDNKSLIDQLRKTVMHSSEATAAYKAIIDAQQGKTPCDRTGREVVAVAPPMSQLNESTNNNSCSSDEAAAGIDILMETHAPMSVMKDNNYFMHKSPFGERFEIRMTALSSRQASDVKTRHDFRKFPHGGINSHNENPANLYTVIDQFWVNNYKYFLEQYELLGQLIESADEGQKGMFLAIRLTLGKLLENATMKIGYTTQGTKELEQRYRTAIPNPAFCYAELELISSKSRDHCTAAEKYIHTKFNAHRAHGVSSAFEGFRVFDFTEGEYYILFIYVLLTTHAYLILTLCHHTLTVQQILRHMLAP
jgi:hypothetical protein